MSLLKDPFFKILYQTNVYVAGNVFEDAYLINKSIKKELYIGSFYGDPKCALIDKNNKWCLIGGEILSVIKEGEEVMVIDTKELNWIIAMRQTGNHVAELLVDPWSEHGSVWQLDVNTMQVSKLKTLDLSNEPNTDDIDW